MAITIILWQSSRLRPLMPYEDYNIDYLIHHIANFSYTITSCKNKLDAPDRVDFTKSTKPIKLKITHAKVEKAAPDKVVSHTQSMFHKPVSIRRS